ncbi:Photosystem I reaction center subunit III, chloroplastic, partial [Linum perenne]
ADRLTSSFHPPFPTAFSAALALSSILLTSAPIPVAADISSPTPCKDSKQFAKREKQSLKKPDSSLKIYAPDSAPADLQRRKKMVAPLLSQIHSSSEPTHIHSSGKRPRSILPAGLSWFCESVTRQIERSLLSFPTIGFQPNRVCQI